MLTQEQLDQYQEEGYLIIKSLFNAEEVELLHHASKNDTVISENSYELLDASGFKTKLALWYTPGNDIYGILEANDGSIWYGSAGSEAGVHRYDGKTITYFKDKESQK
jgi:hypothetical protein